MSYLEPIAEVSFFDDFVNSSWEGDVDIDG